MLSRPLVSRPGDKGGTRQGMYCAWTTKSMHFTKMGTRMTEEQRSAKGNAEREMYNTANDPQPEMIPKLDRKRS